MLKMMEIPRSTVYRHSPGVKLEREGRGMTGLSKLEGELLDALERANWFIHDMMGANDLADRFRKDVLAGPIGKAAAIRAGDPRAEE
jgi:hypothetical protein